jgi:hypothetical protein
LFRVFFVVYALMMMGLFSISLTWRELEREVYYFFFELVMEKTSDPFSSFLVLEPVALLLVSFYVYPRTFKKSLTHPSSHSFVFFFLHSAHTSIHFLYAFPTLFLSRGYILFFSWKRKNIRKPLAPVFSPF